MSDNSLSLILLGWLHAAISLMQRPPLKFYWVPLKHGCLNAEQNRKLIRCKIKIIYKSSKRLSQPWWWCNLILSHRPKKFRFRGVFSLDVHAHADCVVSQTCAKHLAKPLIQPWCKPYAILLKLLIDNTTYLLFLQSNIRIKACKMFSTGQRHCTMWLYTCMYHSFTFFHTFNWCYLSEEKALPNFDDFLIVTKYIVVREFTPWNDSKIRNGL